VHRLFVGRIAEQIPGSVRRPSNSTKAELPCGDPGLPGPPEGVTPMAAKKKAKKKAAKKKK
jgi:hypothetical protein